MLEAFMVTGLPQGYREERCGMGVGDTGAEPGRSRSHRCQAHQYCTLPGASAWRGWLPVVQVGTENQWTSRQTHATWPPLPFIYLYSFF
jgi:hypothetical protein